MSARVGWTPPGVVDEYRLLRPLGRGAMGQVYLAEDTLLQRQVSMKFIASMRPDARARGRFQIEARAIARLSHPNVVSVHRVGEVEGRPYLVAEFIQGRTLAELPRPMPWERVVRIGLGLARGLAAAHRQGVLHRDLKPANVMLTEDEHVKLLDFGLAKLLASPLGEPAAGEGRADVQGLTGDLSGAGDLFGTPLYMAPEVLAGEPATPHSDLYSLGAVLHELCLGRAFREDLRADPPFAEWAHSRSPLLESKAGDPVPGLAAVIARCLEPAPEARFASVEALCGALEALTTRESSGPAAEGNPYRGLQPFEAEHRAFFFGRGTEVQAVLDRLRSDTLLVVTGDSGVGKSSLCRAGVLPLVMEGRLDDHTRYRVSTLVPGRQPFASLVTTLAAAFRLEEDALGSLLSSHPRVLGRELRRAQAPGETLLLFVDQLEELFTLAEPDEAARFAEAIARLASSMSGVRVLMTVRGDFFTRLAALPGLGEELSRALFLLRPLSSAGTRAAITEPARRQGIHFESEHLIEALVDSAQTGAGGLPLLQFAMARLWEARDEGARRIPASALEALGGVSGALAHHADGVLAALPLEQRVATRRLLLALVTDTGTRARRTGAELELGDRAARLSLEALVRGRLVVAREVEGETAYEVAHEALLRGWSTLRRWLDRDGERRLIRARVEAAAAEWARLDRVQGALWGALQLGEAEPLDPGDLSSRGHAFLEASRRSLQRARMRRLGTWVAVPLTIGLVLGGIHLKSRWDLAQLSAERMEAADWLLTEGRQLKQRADRLRREAYVLFDRPAAATPEEGMARQEEAEQVWKQAFKSFRRADVVLMRAAQALEAAWALDPSAQRLRTHLGDSFTERLELAEWFHQKEWRTDLRERLVSMAETETPTRFAAFPVLSLSTSPPGAEVLLERYVEDDEGGRTRVPVGPLGRTPLAERTLEEGPASYLITLKAQGRAEVRYPILLGRGEHKRLELVLPRAGDVPEGYVYVPPGPFLYGSADPEGMREGIVNAQPLHEVHTGAFLIAKQEVTFGEWLEFLDALPPRERERHLPLVPEHQWGLSLTRARGEPWRLSMFLNGQRLTAREGEPLRYPGRTRRSEQDWRRLPVTGISLEDAEAYVSWLALTGRVPRARLCDEREWERAARGADGRAYPHGDQLHPEDANFDQTYGRRPLAFGPDEVGSHPASTSPFGLLDMTGNAYELTSSASVQGGVVIRGGSWYYDVVSDLAANRTVIEPRTRSIDNGLRVCADVSTDG